MGLTFLLSFVFLFGIKGYSSLPDSLWGYHVNDQTFIIHKTQKGESLTSISEMFAAPIAQTTRINQADLSNKLKIGALVKIPIGNYNFMRIDKVEGGLVIPLFYRVAKGEGLIQIGNYFKISPASLKGWNNLPSDKVFVGQILKVGGLKYLPKKDKSVKTAEPTMEEEKQEEAEVQEEVGLAKEFHDRNDGRMLQEVAGAVVFFKPGKIAKGDVYYAFFNDAPRGTILSIYNPATRKAVYAKVIGELPDIPKYHQAIIGLSGNAARALGAGGERIFCRAKY